MIGRLRRVPLREVWPHEEYDFTIWLEQNIDLLNELLGLDLSEVQRERAAGPFSVDLVATDVSGSVVVIENQLEKSDHDHLGKLLTYMTAMEAKTAIWIVGDARPEHVRAITWLNESTSASFYLLKAEAVRIGDSAPAPLLTPIVGPSAEARSAGETKRELLDRQQVFIQFWTGLLGRARPRTVLHANAAPSTGYYVCTSAGVPGLRFCYDVLRTHARVELYLNRSRAAENKAIFRQLYSDRTHIEAAFGRALDWEELPTKQASRIAYRLHVRMLDDVSAWPQIQDDLIDAMIRLEAALKPHLEALDLYNSREI